ncbi:MAG TPA: MlaD family protein, partial [Verrucomicrobiae bacterium]|nr:MlaD family protein [Verrucomicrobiae bacterium]
MSDNPQQPDLNDIPEAVVDPKRRRTLQLVWIIPIVAAVIGAFLAVKAYMEQGPVITITFKSGEGLEAGKTKIRYKGVQIGLVTAVAISPDRSQVIATAELTREADALLVADTRFWIVRARISGGNVSGLGTLMGGSYIGVDAGASKERKLAFQGLENPPAVAMDLPGRQFILHAEDIGSLDIGSPIFYRRIQVGEVTAYQLDKGGKGVTLTVFVRSPYDQYVKGNTLFWHASGLDITLDASGVKLSTESMVSVLMGGISFQTPEDHLGSTPAAANTEFVLFGNQEEAMKRPDTVVETYVMVFKESVRGLSVGAPVDLRGVTVGEVTKINVDLDARRKEFTMPVEVRVYPERLRARYRNKPVQSRPHEVLNAIVENGLRGQLRSGNLLTGQMYVALDFFPKAPPAKIDWSKSPPEFPTVPGSMEQLQAMLMHIAQKIEKLPVEELAGDARQAVRSLDSAMKSAEAMVKQIDASVLPEARSTLEDVRKTLDEVRQTLSGAKQTLSADAPLQQDLRETMRELSRAAQSLRSL